ncbi:MAG: hypothetical protein II979_06665 [Clostridia bacterium]|nr:hypothetical protein [Clostridia bacterium]
MGEGGFHTAPCHDGVGGTYRDRFPEPYSDGTISILLQKGIVNDADDVTAMIVPEFVGKIGSDFLKNIMERYIRHAVILLKRIEHRIHVFLFHPPQVHRTGILTCSGVGKIIHIFQLWCIGIMINQSNPFGATADVPAHGFVPCIVICTSGSIGTLGVDHELFVVGVLVQPGGSVEKGSPVFQTVSKLSGGLLCQFSVILQFILRHPCPPVQ